ncbi:helix-turn-helix domain-containing protein [Photobacterium damselae subsp. damselae]|uniref:helix-turn-helix domain-containing protein n=1 Tax=Photobacterium damselae TaxID=38293 RepID=UPI00311AD9A6
MTKSSTINTGPDMHRADIVAALHKNGLSLRELSVSNGLAPTTLRNALERAWPKGERIIANAINRTPEEIWPSRYNKGEAA